MLALQQGLFAPRALPRFTATTAPSVTLSPSTDFPVSPVIRFSLPRIFSTGRGGFLQLLNVSLSSCRRYRPARASRRISQSATVHVAFTSACEVRPLGVFLGLEVTYTFTFVTARRLAHHPKDGFVDRLHALRFLHACDPSYRFLTFLLVGLPPPTEHISLSLDIPCRRQYPGRSDGICSLVRFHPLRPSHEPGRIAESRIVQSLRLSVNIAVVKTVIFTASPCNHTYRRFDTTSPSDRQSLSFFVFHNWAILYLSRVQAVR
jgi:hypothetical protein